ncbi:hypothetical protein TL16_g08769 [Triparma laevis f. inornata]|uniref:Zinc finger CHCC-type domain-containing protein n=1 Tax=Triparma laevis f. inornata TaxID=1714386 RepID=A0A9W7AXZ1_9STRA|nr:hypothetical protein TL16_g08769 [Triparma laevis f. inornata]
MHSRLSLRLTPTLRASLSRTISTTSPVLGGAGPVIHETMMHYPKPEKINDKHRSNGMKQVFDVPPIEVDGDVAGKLSPKINEPHIKQQTLTTTLNIVCEGGAGALGHPVEYITLKIHSSTDRLAGVCKYCSLRYVGKKH